MISFMQPSDNMGLTFLLSGQFYAKVVLLKSVFLHCIFVRPTRLFNNLMQLIICYCSW